MKPKPVTLKSDQYEFPLWLLQIALASSRGQGLGAKTMAGSPSFSAHWKKQRDSHGAILKSGVRKSQGSCIKMQKPHSSSLDHTWSLGRPQLSVPSSVKCEVSGAGF